MSFIPQRYLDSTLAIGQRGANSKTHWMGTGLLLGWLSTPPGQSPQLYDAFLVTNRHVLEGEKAVVIRFNLIEPRESIDFEVPLVFAGEMSAVTFHADSEIDVAAVKLDDSVLQSSGVHIQAFISNRDIYPLQQAGWGELREGSSIFVLGYPMGLVSEKRQFAICRAGCIARIRDFYAGQAKDFLIDAAVFPGNSGGPVIARWRAQEQLIGIVYAYELYEDIAVSMQTFQKRITFQENSGLARVVPIDRIIECVEENFRNGPPSAALNRIASIKS